jgi:hypothetical protein
MFVKFMKLCCLSHESFFSDLLSDFEFL